MEGLSGKGSADGTVGCATSGEGLGVGAEK
jgi:hypothetical protein